MSSSTDAFFAPLTTRHSIYKLDKSSPISNERIQEIVAFAVKHAPSPFNVQSARVIILLGAEHEKLWDFGLEALKASLPEAAYAALSPKVLGLKAGYGSVSCSFRTFPEFRRKKERKKERERERERERDKSLPVYTNSRH
jgi:predicted oxidoreductase (fatty acid repression mutant protein)